MKQLDKEFIYKPDLNSTKFAPGFTASDYLDNYVYRADCVLKFLRKQKWVDTNRIAVFGHSQGAYVALKLAETNPDIRIVGFASGHPEGRFPDQIRSIRRSVIAKKISPEMAQVLIDNQYGVFRNMLNDIHLSSEVDGNQSRNWTSFTAPYWSDLVKLKTPLCVLYGTEDLDPAESCELLPIYFMKYGKANYKMMPFVGCGHNFEEIDSIGKHNWEKLHWQEAINGFLSWWESLENKTLAVSNPPYDKNPYILKEATTDNCIDIPNGRNDNGLELKLWNVTNGINQQWLFVRKGDNYQIVSAYTAKAITASTDSVSHKIKITQEEPADSINQLWEITKQGTGYIIRSKWNGHLLTAMMDKRIISLIDIQDEKSALWNIQNIR